MPAIGSKIAIVTGGGGGIGGAIVRRFAQEGARLAVADIDAAAAKVGAAAAAGRGPRPLRSRSTSPTRNQWRAWSRQLSIAGVGSISWSMSPAALIANSSIDMTAADWDHIVDMNLKSVFLCSQAVLPTMLEAKIRQDRQHLVDLRLHRQRYALQLRRCQSRRRGFHQISRLEVAKEGINVNAVAPGRVATERVRSHYSDEAWAEAVAQIPAWPHRHTRRDRRSRALSRD